MTLIFPNHLFRVLTHRSNISIAKKILTCVSYSKNRHVETRGDFPLEILSSYSKTAQHFRTFQIRKEMEWWSREEAVSIHYYSMNWKYLILLLIAVSLSCVSLK